VGHAKDHVISISRAGWGLGERTSSFSQDTEILWTLSSSTSSRASCSMVTEHSTRCSWQVLGGRNVLVHEGVSTINNQGTSLAHSSTASSTASSMRPQTPRVLTRWLGWCHW